MIDHVLINSFINTNFKTVIIKINIFLSVHFPIYFLLPASTANAEAKVTQIAKIFNRIDTIKIFDPDFYKASHYLRWSKNAPKICFDTNG